MLNKTFELEITSEAYHDLVDIENYTFSEFGENQWKKYGQKLDTSLQSILKNPLIGHTRIDIPRNYLSLPIGEHILIYRISESTIYLLRVLHNKMDFPLRF
jgi:toxin ParE1/3/4